MLIFNVFNSSFWILSVTFLFSCASSNKEDFIPFLEKLTYPSSQWSETDFGLVPEEEQKYLLRRFAPQFYLTRGECAPMDFYQQYVPNLQLIAAKKPSLVGKSGTRELLKKVERDFEAKWKLNFNGDCIQSKRPPLYAVTWQENMSLGEAIAAKPIRVLKYTFTFYKSGLPAEQSFLQRGAWFLGDTDLWHYLDIHGAVFYLLDEENQPISLVLAQHNHFRSYVIGKDITLEQSQKICFAKRSNEPYVCHGRQSDVEYPTAPTYKYMRWIVSEKERPFLGAWDVVSGVNERQEISYQVKFLSSRDPLKTSWSGLGPDLDIWGIFPTFFRKSPPGMDIFNTPKLKPIWKTAQFVYFDPKDSRAFEVHEKNSSEFLNPNVDPILEINGPRFVQALSEAKNK